MESIMKIKESPQNNKDVINKYKLTDDNNDEIDVNEEDDDEEEGIIKEDVSLTPPSLTPPLLSPVSDSLSPFPLMKTGSNSNPNTISNQTSNENTSQIPNPKQIETESYLTFFHTKKGVAHRTRFFTNYANYKHYYPVATSEYRSSTNIIVKSDLGPYSHSKLNSEEAELKLDPELLKAEKKLSELEEKLENNHLQNAKKSKNELLNSKKKLADKSTTKFKKREEDMQFKFMEEVEMKPFDLFAFKDSDNQIHFIRKSFVSFTESKPTIAFSENSKFWRRNFYQKLDEIFKLIPLERVSIIKEFLDNIKKNNQNQHIENKSIESFPIRNWWYIACRSDEEKSQNCTNNSIENTEQFENSQLDLIYDFTLDNISTPHESPVLPNDNNYINFNNCVVNEQDSSDKSISIVTLCDSKNKDTLSDREKMVHKVIHLLNNNSENGIYDDHDDDFLKQILGEENHKLMLELRKQYDQSMSSSSSLSSANKSFDEQLNNVSSTSDDIDGWDIESCLETQINFKLDTSDLLKLNNESIVLPEIDNYTPLRSSSKSPNSASLSKNESFSAVKINPSTPSSTPPPTPEKIQTKEAIITDKKDDSRDKSIDISKKDKSCDKTSNSSKSKTSSTNKSSKNPYKSKPRSLTPPVDNKRRKLSKSYSRSRSRSHSRSRGNSKSYHWRRHSRNRWRGRKRTRSRSQSRTSSSSHRKHRSSNSRSYHNNHSHDRSSRRSRSDSKKKQSHSNEKFEKNHNNNNNNKEVDIYYNENENNYLNGHVYCDQNDTTSYFNNDEYMNYENPYYDVNFDSYKQNIQTDLTNDTNDINCSENNNLIFANMIGGPINSTAMTLPTPIPPPIPVPPPEPVEPPPQIVLEDQINNLESYDAVALSGSPRRLSLDDRIQNELNKNNFQDVRQVSGFGVTTQLVQVGNVLQILPVNSSMQLNGNIQNVAMEELMKEYKAEKEKRKQERANKRLLKEQIRRERDKRRKLRIKSKADKLLKKLLSLDSDHEISIKMEESTDEKPHTTQNDSIKCALLDIKKEMCDHMITSDDINEKDTITKCVMFADGVKPGEGESPITSPVELQSPSLFDCKRVLLKGRKRRNLRMKKYHKSKKKIKVKVVHDSENSIVNNLPPPSPPPGSPPPHIWPYPKSFNYKEYLYNMHQSSQQPLQQFPLIFPPIYANPVQTDKTSKNGPLQATTNHSLFIPQAHTLVAANQQLLSSSNKTHLKTSRVNGSAEHFVGSQGIIQTPHIHTVNNEKDTNEYSVTNDLDFISLPPPPPPLSVTDSSQ